MGRRAARLAGEFRGNGTEGGEEITPNRALGTTHDVPCNAAVDEWRQRLAIRHVGSLAMFDE
jgi:hypothetical protein